jgi:hypothetical protein
VSGYRSAFSRLLPSIALAALGCGPLEPEVVTLDVRAHSIDASERCAVVGDPNLVLHALGPFPVSDLAAEALRYRTPERALTFPDDTRGLEAVADDGARSWLGYTERRTERGLDVLLWEDDRDCELLRPAVEGYPGVNGGQAQGYSPEAGVVLVAGGDQLAGAPTAAAASGSLFFESDTGASGLVTPGQNFAEPRAFATVTAFGSKLVLAGGESPLNTDVPGERAGRDSAFVYDPNAHGFERDPITLEFERTRHAAVVLRSGETLLVGGARSLGSGMRFAVTPFEVLSPATRHSRTDGLLGLANGRLEPTALVLDNGNVLVGGGYDPSGAPVDTVEYFSPDGSSQVSPGATRCGVPLPPCVTLAPRHHRVFVALPGGGALTVGGCAPAEVQTGGCVSACGADFGCPAAEADADWIAADGEKTPITFEQPLGCPTPFSPERVLLAPGSDGAPWVLAYDEDVEPPCPAAFRFAPWQEPPVLARVELDFEHWPDPRTRLTTLGPDAFVWLTADDPPLLAGTRQGTRGTLSQNETLLDFAPEVPEVPLHLAPDRRPAHPDNRPRALYRQGPRLILETSRDGYPPVGVFVTDARYEDVTISMSFTTSGPPVLLLDTFALGSEPCPWPADATSPLVVVRRGGKVTATDGAGNESRCSNAPEGSVALGFRAGANSATLTSLSVVRN